MGRWQPDARGRLGRAAMELYSEQGYEQTTVVDIAERAGLTSRTFFRYFGDKREVIFAGSDELVGTITDVVAAAPDGAAPLAVVSSALDTVAALVGGDREHSRARQKIIVANPELAERERTKLASWSRVLAEALRGRGVDEPAASLAAEAGVAVFRVSFERWIADPGDHTLIETLHDSFAQLRAVAG